jgi:uncharacterized membrane protein YdbT with pleckstrin-like domain
MAAAADAADAADAIQAPIATLLAGHVVHPGEIVQMVIKPSRWFVLLQSLWFIGAAIIVIGALNLTQFRPIGSTATNLQLLIFLIIVRMMWAVLQWMGRYYLVTDLRVIRLSGVLSVNIMAFPLKAVATVRCYPSFVERIFGKGSIEITSPDEPVMIWQTLSRPQKVCEQIQAAVARARHNGNGAA